MPPPRLNPAPAPGPAAAPPAPHAPPGPGPHMDATAREEPGKEREIEWQLAATDLGLVRTWLGRHPTLDGLSIKRLPTLHLHDTYLDTPDWRIFRAGFALRLREERGGKVEATLKGLRSARDDLADRRELTEPLPGRSIKALARAEGPVGSRVRDVTGSRPLRTLFEVHTSRRRFAVLSRDPSRQLGEIALDETQFSRSDSHRSSTRLKRVEVESAGPEHGSLERLANRLRAECGLHPATENKFAAGLRSVGLEPPQGRKPDETAAPAPDAMDVATGAREFAIAALQRLVDEWCAHEPGARLGESPEALHALRVTGRRMDTVLSLFGAYLPAALRRSRPKLKSLLRALGAVRDVDIRVAVASTFRNSLAETDRRALDPLLGQLADERREAHSTMLRVLDAKPARQWLDALPDQLARAAAQRVASARTACALAVVPDLLRRRYRKLRKCARQMRPGSPMGEYHKLRIHTKKLRYALEVVAPSYAKPAREMLGALRKLQSRLGIQHDGDAVHRYLTQLAKQPPAGFGSQTLFLIGRLAEPQSRNAIRMGDKVEKSWRKVRGRRWKTLRSRMQDLRDGTAQIRSKPKGIADGPVASARDGSASADADGS